MDKDRMQGLVDDAAECWENMGLTLGSQIFEDEDGWHAVLHPLPVEIDGKRVEAFNESDTIYLLDVINLFESVEDFFMYNREIQIAGKIDGTTVYLELWMYVPEGEEVVDQISSKPPSLPPAT